jgi:serine/threonine protein kinase/Tfp pilus assembly protein PilF
MTEKQPTSERSAKDGKSTPAQPSVSCEDSPAEVLVSQVVDEFMEARERGARPDIEDYCTRHPSIAKVLRQVLPALDLVRFADNETTAAPLGGCLGDYCILREIGRGGMGVVYEAEQISLNRRVALKVLPFAAALDPQRLQRFKNEAQAAAHLHHQNIVPVYGVGCERGVHYYAMQFIEGQTLAALIDELRGQTAVVSGQWPVASNQEAAAVSPCPENDAKPLTTGARHSAASDRLSAESRQPIAESRGLNTSPAFFRTVAQIGTQAAEALEYAHQVGIIHRDIKPANLLLQNNPSQSAPVRVWITDFGLAHVQDDSRLTLTGDLVGTMRYMSPEQALGKGPVDQRTDVYALGATLYELLTLKPTLPGRDRRELMRQIAFEEPLPLRAVNRSIPVELETIVLKAVAKEADSRYATAQELADDLHRFLDDKPIQARRPSLWEKTKKWSRRHRPVVVSAVVGGVLLLVLGLAGLVVYNRHIAQERDEKKAAFLVAKEQQQKAEANLHQALNAIERMLAQVNDRELVLAPGLAKVRLKISQDALDLCRQLQEAGHTDPAARHYIARAYYLAGTLKFDLGQPGASENDLRKAMHNFQELAGEFPGVPAYRAGWAQTCQTLAGNLRRAGRFHQAEAAFQQAIHLWKDVLAQRPSALDFQEKLANTVSELGYLYWAMDRHSQAEAKYQEALKLLEQLHRSGRGLGLHIEITNALGVLQRTTGQWPQAEETFQQALQLVEKYSAGGGLQDVRAHGHLGIVLWQLGREAEAEPHLRQAVALREKIQLQSPYSGEARQELILTQRWWAQWLAWMGRDQEAEKLFQKIVQAHEELTTQHPGWADYPVHLALSRGLLANLYRDTGRPEKADPLYRQALDFQEKDAFRHPNDAQKQLVLARTAEDLGRLLFGQGKLADAGAYFKKAQQAFQNAARLSPKRHDVQQHLARFLADCPDPKLRDPDKALAGAEKAIGLAPQDPSCWNTLGKSRYRAGRNKEAIKALEQAMALRSGGNSVDWFLLAMAHAKLGDKAQAAVWYDRAQTWMDQHQPRNAELIRYRHEADRLVKPPAKIKD